MKTPVKCGKLKTRVLTSINNNGIKQHYVTSNGDEICGPYKKI